VVVLSGVFLLVPFPAASDVFFSPDGGLRESLLKELESTTQTIDIAVFEITSPDLAEALTKAKQRGVRVRVITDSRQAKSRTSKVTSLISHRVMVKVLGGREKGAMNHRFILLDGKKVITGSFSWAENADRWNFENMILLQENEAVSAYQNEFDRLWREKRVIK
jgi:phosphatidylserine/phosphatidylglycerophosphate/cardiolipin synthase-like enzyme